MKIAYGNNTGLRKSDIKPCLVMLRVLLCLLGSYFVSSVPVYARDLSHGLAASHSAQELPAQDLQVPPVQIITHPDLQIRSEDIKLSRLRSIFGMRTNQWPDGTPIKVFVLPDQHSVHKLFCRSWLKTYPYIVRQNWNRLVYTGTGQAPITVANVQEMLALVATTPGAIGYINGEQEHAKLPVRVLD